MKRLWAVIAVAAIVGAIGCRPIEQRIVAHPNGDVEVFVKFALPSDDATLAQAAAAGVPVSQQEAAEFLKARGYELAQKGFSKSEPDDEGYITFDIKATPTPRAATALANRLNYSQVSGSEYRLDFDPGLMRLDAGEKKPYEVNAALLRDFENENCVTQAEFPGKILSSSGGARSTSPRASIVTWRQRIGRLMEKDVAPYTASVRILSEADPGKGAYLLLLGAFVAFLLGLIMVLVQTKRAGGSTRGKVTRAHGHAVR